MEWMNSVSLSSVRSAEARLEWMYSSKKEHCHPPFLIPLSLESFINVVNLYYKDTKKTDKGLWWEKQSCLWLILLKTNKKKNSIAIAGLPLSLLNKLVYFLN